MDTIYPEVEIIFPQVSLIHIAFGNPIRFNVVTLHILL